MCPCSFHARGSALSRRYAYVLLESPVRPSVDAGKVGWVFRPMQLEPMQQAAQALLGEHDFTSFRASQCQAHSPVKNLMRADISRRGAYWRFEFEASAFLHHMIRNIMGCLIAIGTGQRPPGWMAEVIEARSRDAAAPTFSPDGLYFLGPTYDPAFGLPDRTPGLRLVTMSDGGITSRLGANTDCAMDLMTPHRTRIKICGLTRESDVDAAVQAGADAIGLCALPQKPEVCLARTRRRARRPPACLRDARCCCSSMPAPNSLPKACSAVPHALLQFHGDETAGRMPRRGPPFHARCTNSHRRRRGGL